MPSASVIVQASLLGLCIAGLIAIIVVLALPKGPTTIYGPWVAPRPPDHTLALPELIKLGQAQTQLVKDKASFWRPDNRAQLDAALTFQANATTYAGVVLPQQISSGTALGYNALIKLPQDRTLLAPWWPFNFDYSSVGWYWCFGTFDDAFYICYIVRMQAASPEARGPMVTAPQTTCYFVSVGVGVKGSTFWRTPFLLAGGEYAQTENHGWVLETSGAKIVSLAPGHLSLEATFDGATVALHAVFSEDPVLNGSNGDAPRVAGTGTSYWSYTNGTAQLAFRRTASSPTQTFADGYAWLDRQVIRADSPNTGAGCMSWNLANMWGSTRGLAPYVWIVVRIDGDGQYMIVATPLPREKDGMPLVGVGQRYTAWYQYYAPDNSNPLSPTRTTLETTSVNPEGTFPTGYRVTLNANTVYDLDGSMFGEAWTWDPANSQHWSGGCYVSLNGSRIGRGLLEANGFHSTEQGTLNVLAAIEPGEPQTQEQVAVYTPGSQLTCYWRAMTALAAFAIVLAILGLVILIITLPMSALQNSAPEISATRRTT